MTSTTNWLAIIVAAAVGMGIGFLFYGVLFLDTWAEGNGLEIINDEMFRNGEKIPMSAAPMIVNAISMVVYAIVLDWLAHKINFSTFAGGAKLGAMVGLAFLFSHYVQKMFEARPNMLGAIDGIYHLVLMVVIGAIVAGWRKS